MAHSKNRSTRPQQQQNEKPKPNKPTQPSKPTLKVIPLGGLDVIGKNMTLIEYGDDMIMVDAGLMFPDDDHLGVDLILPDYTYVIENQHKLKAIVITHGHEDHTGTLPYLIRDLEVDPPIIATRLTLGLIRGKLSEFKMDNYPMQEAVPGQHIKKGVFGLDFIHLNHSIPDACAVFIRTPVGNILHTGDFKFDQTPVDGQVSDYGEIARLSKAGVMLLLSDSTGAEMPGVTRSESEVGKELQNIIDQAEGKVIVASFASHIHRLQQIADAAKNAGRKIVVTGRSMLQNTAIARELGYLEIEDRDYIDAYEIKKLPSDKIVVMCTGSQGEPLSALSRIAAGEHKTIRIDPGDTVILSATPVPGNERAVTNVINQLVRRNARVYHKGSSLVHVSGHAASEELKLMLNLVQPEYFMPVHGEPRHLMAHRQIALDVGIPPEYIFVMDNGEVLEFDDEGAMVTGTVPNGMIYVDGLNVGDTDHVVLRDRQHLSQDGMVTLIMTVNMKRRTVLGDVQVIARGVSVHDESFTEDLTKRTMRTLKRSLEDGAQINAVRRAVRESISQLIYEKTKTRPMVIPVIIEV
ncbi:MAG: ribonuclease J [Actinomycetia bacterium]|nr:ribonuclease J [Actinomycetes bacterium]